MTKPSDIIKKRADELIGEDHKTAWQERESILHLGNAPFILQAILEYLDSQANS